MDTLSGLSRLFPSSSVAYSLIAISVINYQYHAGRFTTPMQMIILILFTLFGFLVFPPVAQYQF